jgi:uncharacterized membrane protein YphA (DoxX/SURF4 family)
MIMFMKNVAIIGGFLIIVSTGDGAYASITAPKAAVEHVPNRSL